MRHLEKQATDGPFAYNASGSHTWTLFRACKTGDHRLAQVALEANVDVNERSDERETPLITAAKYGSAVVMEYLLKHGAGVNYVNDIGRTALMMACRQGEARCVRILLRTWQADFDKTDTGGNTALSIAASVLAGESYLDCIRLLIEEDAEVNTCNDSGMTSLMYCARNLVYGLRAIHILIDAGANVDAVNDFGETVFLLAAYHGNSVVLDYFLQGDKEILNQTNNFGDNALILALRQGNSENVRHLLEAGSDPNSYSGQRCHALNIAACNSFDNVLLLLSFGARPTRSTIHVLPYVLEASREMLPVPLFHCTTLFTPTDVAVLHQNFTTANFLLTQARCKPSYTSVACSRKSAQVEQEAETDIKSYISKNANLCQSWVNLVRSIKPEPPPLFSLCLSAVSAVIGFSEGRHKRVHNSGLPPTLCREILFENVIEQMFALDI